VFALVLAPGAKVPGLVGRTRAEAVAALRKPIEAAELVLAATRARRGASPDTNQFVVLPHVERMPAEG
jgi:hypothetical protein